MTSRDAHFYGYERTPRWLFWMPPWRGRVMIYGYHREVLRRDWIWMYAWEPS